VGYSSPFFVGDKLGGDATARRSTMDPSTQELMQLADQGGAFDFLHDEADLYSIEDGEAVQWAELKREIAIGVEEADRGELIDGDVVFQQLRDRLEQQTESGGFTREKP
jgi:antitoxin ParD1/3/4